MTDKLSENQLKTGSYNNNNSVVLMIEQTLKKLRVTLFEQLLFMSQKLIMFKRNEMKFTKLKLNNFN